MQGGPSQFETFSPKPGHANGGETKAIPTAVPGIQIADRFPELAKQAKDIAFIRSVNSREGAHPRAQLLMHTGYLPMATVKYPTLGSIVAHELGDSSMQLPSFVRDRAVTATAAARAFWVSSSIRSISAIQPRRRRTPLCRLASMWPGTKTVCN